MVSRTLVALFIVLGLGVAAPTQAAPARAPTATTVPVAIAWGREFSSLLAVYDTLSYDHDVFWARLSAIESMCDAAESSEATYPDVARAEWGSMDGGVNNNNAYWHRVVNPALIKLKSGAAQLRVHFAKKFTAKKERLISVGTDYIQVGVVEWGKADTLAVFGEFSMTAGHNCSGGESQFLQANKVLLNGLDEMESGVDLLEKV